MEYTMAEVHDLEHLSVVLNVFSGSVTIIKI